MNFSRYFFRSAAIVAVPLLFHSIFAFSMPVTIDGGENVTYNFDFRDALDSAFENPRIHFDFQLTRQVATGEWEFFDSFDGNGPLITTVPSNVSMFSTNASALTDGILSARLTLYENYTSVNPFAYIEDDANRGTRTVDLFGVRVIETPEPLSLALVAVALAGVALTRRSSIGRILRS